MPENAPWYVAILVTVLGAIGVALRSAGTSLFALIERDRLSMISELKANREQNERTQQSFITFLQAQNGNNVDLHKMNRQSLDEHTEVSKTNNRLLINVAERLDKLISIVEKKS